IVFQKPPLYSITHNHKLQVQPASQRDLRSLEERRMILDWIKPADGPYYQRASFCTQLSTYLHSSSQIRTELFDINSVGNDFEKVCQAKFALVVFPQFLRYTKNPV